MRVILVIAKNTFREAVRDRIFYGIVGFGALFIILDTFFAELALGDMVMIKSVGLAGIYLFSLIITIFLGSSIIFKEMERKTLYFILPKPVSRSEVVKGKFLGLFSAVFITNLLMFALYFLVILYEKGGADLGGAIAVFFQILEMAIFVALLVFLSSLVKPLTATMSSLMLLFTGHLLPTAFLNAQEIGGFANILSSFLYYFLPNLEKFNVRNLVVHNIYPSVELFLISVAYALLYIVLLLYGACKVFNKREI